MAILAREPPELIPTAVGTAFLNLLDGLDPRKNGHLSVTIWFSGGDFRRIERCPIGHGGGKGSAVNYDVWAEWYDVIYSTDRRGEVEFYVDLAERSGGPVLEIGVGTGRIAIPTAQVGVDVVGIDLNEPMLGRARVKFAEAGELSGSLELIRADMRDFDLGRRFPLVTIPARALLLATTSQEQQRALACAANHVASGGSLVFNVFMPDPVMLNDSSRDRFFWGEAVNPRNGRRCLLWALNRFDALAQTNDGLQIVEELDERGEIARKVCLEVKIRYLHASEVHEMLDAAGLVAEAVYGHFDRSPLTEDSQEMIWVCQRRA